MNIDSISLFYVQSFQWGVHRCRFLVKSHCVHSYSRHGPATARLTSERPGNVIHVPKRLPSWKYVVYRSVTLRQFIYLLSFTVLFVRIFWLSNSLHPLNEPEGSCQLQCNVFEMAIRDGCSRVCCASSLTSSPLHHPWYRDQVSCRDNYKNFPPLPIYKKAFFFPLWRFPDLCHLLIL